jgi:hypothetical protein
LRACGAIGTVAAIASLLCSIACSSNSSTGRSQSGPQAGAATAGEIDGLCDAQCARSARCNKVDGMPGSATCPQSCKDDLGNLATSVRGDIVRSLTDCYTNLACGVNDDRCLGDAVVATGEPLDAALHAPDVTSCLQKEIECHETAGAFSDDDCGTLAVLVAAKRAEAGHCFTLPCEAIPMCLAPIFGH